jgi:hypothetical protein
LVNFSEYTNQQLRSAILGNELMLRSGWALERQHAQNIEARLRQAELIDVDVSCARYLTKRAINGAIDIYRTVDQAMLIAPGGEQAYLLLAGKGSMEMAAALDRINRAW